MESEAAPFSPNLKNKQADNQTAKLTRQVCRSKEDTGQIQTGKHFWNAYAYCSAPEGKEKITYKYEVEGNNETEVGHIGQQGMSWLHLFDPESEFDSSDFKYLTIPVLFRYPANEVKKEERIQVVP